MAWQWIGWTGTSSSSTIEDVPVQWHGNSQWSWEGWHRDWDEVSGGWHPWHQEDMCIVVELMPDAVSGFHQLDL